MRHENPSNHDSGGGIIARKQISESQTVYIQFLSNTCFNNYEPHGTEKFICFAEGEFGWWVGWTGNPRALCIVLRGIGFGFHIKVRP